jgi:hypothetical protein
MVQIYIKHSDNDFYLLDLEPNEAINFKLTVKDLGDITKIFSPFTQSFKIKATDKNKILCGFIGNEKILRANNTGEFDSLIYISGFLFQSGKLSFEESSYEFQEQKEFSTTFSSTVSGLVDKLGDSTIQDLFKDIDGNFDEAIKTDWNKIVLKDRMQSVKNTTLSNGINFKYGIPFISNNRVWTYDDDNLGIVDNIAYKKNKVSTDVNFVNLAEVRPAVNYLSIMESLILKYDLKITCPIFEKPEVKDLFVWCNSESLIVPDASAFPLVDYSALTYLRYDSKDQINGISIPTSPKWQVTEVLASGIFKIKRDSLVYLPTKWSDGFDINLKFNGLIPLEGTETKIKVVIKNATTGVPLDTQEITGNTYVWRFLDPINAPSMLDTNGEIYLSFEILPITLVSWTNIEFKTIQKFRYNSTGSFGIPVTTRASFSATALNNTLSTNLGGNKINLITTLPKMKCIDFLRSFFKTFNISILSTGLNDQSMHWVTPSDIQELNKPYSKRIVDYTDFTDVATLTKKKGNQYNQYLFSHKDSKYYESTYGNGTKFGALEYPTIVPSKPTKFEVKTDYSILKQGSNFNHPSTAKTCFGFTKDTPTVLDNGGNRYKPVYEEFTLFYLQLKNLGNDFLSVENSPTVNNQLYSVLEASFKNSFNGKTLAFGAEVPGSDSLYLNYYKNFIELLLNPNTYQSSFNLVLPPNEIFLNFTNTNQGESNIPMGFRAQNEIIIGEQRYTLVDSAIDLTTGKTKLNLLNF